MAFERHCFALRFRFGERREGRIPARGTVNQRCQGVLALVRTKSMIKSENYIDTGRKREVLLDWG